VIKVNFRLIAATNRNLEEAVRQGAFREDLFYRLNVVRLVVPPLRERPEDITLLFAAFLRRFAAEQGQPAPIVTPPIGQMLLRYSWPGNVRELRNLAERLSIFAAGRELRLDDFPSNYLAAAAAGAPSGAGLPAGVRSVGAGVSGGAAPAPAHALAAATAYSPPVDLLDLQEIERRTIERALGQFGGNRSAAAEALGISRRTLQRKLKEYQMQGSQELPDEGDGADSGE
ncbi:MAG: sigma 54-interacting transcriptional regulator, partial [bacterium]|nr:sigma 54-interacting transcriptional regulator [bacterium]